jgi:hypothetical protein
LQCEQLTHQLKEALKERDDYKHEAQALAKKHRALQRQRDAQLLTENENLR